MTFYSVNLNPPEYVCSGRMPKPYYFVSHRKAINFCKKNNINPATNMSYYDLPTNTIKELYRKIEKIQERINDLRSANDL